MSCDRGGRGRGCGRGYPATYVGGGGGGGGGLLNQNSKLDKLDKIVVLFRNYNYLLHKLLINTKIYTLIYSSKMFPSKLFIAMKCHF